MPVPRCRHDEQQQQLGAHHPFSSGWCCLCSTAGSCGDQPWWLPSAPVPLTLAPAGLDAQWTPGNNRERMTLAPVCICLQLQAHWRHGTDPTPKLGEQLGSLGEFIAAQRRSAQLTLRQLAEQTGISNPYLSQIERGLRRPSAEVLQQLSRRCGSRPRRSTSGPDPRSGRPCRYQCGDGRAGRRRDHRAAEAGADRRLRLLCQGERGPPSPATDDQS